MNCPKCNSPELIDFTYRNKSNRAHFYCGSYAYRDGSPGGFTSDECATKQELKEERALRIKAERERDEYRDMLHSICEKAFGMDDTKSCEPYDEYILRQIEKIKADAENWYRQYKAMKCAGTTEQEDEIERLERERDELKNLDIVRDFSRLQAEVARLSESSVSLANKLLEAKRALERIKSVSYEGCRGSDGCLDCGEVNEIACGATNYQSTTNE